MAKKIKERLLASKQEWPKKYILTDWEFNYINTMSAALIHNVHRDRLIGGMLNYIGSSRLALPKPPTGSYYKFEIDLEDTSHELGVTEVKSADS